MTLTHRLLERERGGEMVRSANGSSAKAYERLCTVVTPSSSLSHFTESDRGESKGLKLVRIATLQISRCSPSSAVGNICRVSEQDSPENEPMKWQSPVLQKPQRTRREATRSSLSSTSAGGCRKPITDHANKSRPQFVCGDRLDRCGCS